MTRTAQDVFAEAIDRFEGGLSLHKNDAGNYANGKLIGSKFGVTPQALATYRNVPLFTITREVMASLTRGEAIEIGLALYYRGPGFDRLPWCPATEVWIDIGWGSGPAVAVAGMQRMIGASPDGVIGPATIAAYERWLQSRSMAQAVDAIADWRCEFYRDLVRRRPKNADFITGWLRRANWYRSTNVAWYWGAELGSIPVGSPEAGAIPVDGKIAPPGVEDAKKLIDSQTLVQGGAVAGSTLAGAAAIFKAVPGWAAGAALLIVVALSAWAIVSFLRVRKVL